MSDKIEAMQKAPPPQNVSELKSYLGLLSYYGKFLPQLATKLASLYALLSSTTRWRWTKKEAAAFRDSKELLLSSQVLVHFDLNQELVLSCDASPYGVGAVLSHRFSDGTDRLIGFASRSLTKAERKYLQLEKEGLACIFGVKRFHSNLYGHKFTLITDHKPLLGLLGEIKAIPTQASARIQRWALTLAAYEYTFCYRSGGNHEPFTTSRGICLSTSTRRSCFSDGVSTRFTYKCGRHQEGNITSSSSLSHIVVCTMLLAKPM